MTETMSANQPVLVYRRIAANRRKAWLLITLTVLAVLPFVLGISYGVAAYVASKVSPDVRRERLVLERQQAFFRGLPNRTDWSAAEEDEIERRLQAVDRKAKENSALVWELTSVVSAALIAGLGMLFWAIASSPTSKLLVQAGAQPAGASEDEARRLLENLAIGAGLPTPKLYVIEAGAPNAFAAGMDPHHAVVVVTRGALRLFDHRELEGVLAHEISHIGNDDIRLNSFAASIALFLRIPYSIWREGITHRQHENYYNTQRRYGAWKLLFSPVWIYILFVAPVLGALLRAAVSREREYLADADAALLTRYPEGLMRALAKIGGAGSAMSANPAFSHFYFADPVKAAGAWSNPLMATHPPLADRIQRLMQYEGAVAPVAVKEAIEQGRQYASEHPTTAVLDPTLNETTPDDLAVLRQGNTFGRVYRMLATVPVPVYDAPTPHSTVMARIQPGALFVAFDDPTKLRQVSTADQTFGYIERSVKLQAMPNVIPNEIYDPKTRAAIEAALPPPGAPKAVVNAVQNERAAAGPGGLTGKQIAIASVFCVTIFGVFLLLLMKFAG
jgi:heat shock protein HtpX